MGSRLAIISFLDEHDGPPVYPGHGLPPVHGRPDNSLPGGPATLPVYPFDPTIDNSLPGGGGHPSTGPIVPGARFIVKWLACVGLILVPDNSLPTQPGHPDHSLPPSAGHPSHPLPPSPGHPDQSLPPAPAPKK